MDVKLFAPASVGATAIPNLDAISHNTTLGECPCVATGTYNIMVNYIHLGSVK
jgi:hypothetical protein